MKISSLVNKKVKNMKVAAENKKKQQLGFIVIIYIYIHKTLSTVLYMQINIKLEMRPNIICNTYVVYCISRLKLKVYKEKVWSDKNLFDTTKSGFPSDQCLTELQSISTALLTCEV